MATADHTAITPFRFRELQSKMLLTNEIGDYGVFEDGIIDRFYSDSLTLSERTKLQELSILVEPNAEWRLASLQRRITAKHAIKSSKLSYLIIVPTLRCNLTCGYCQVSRAPLNATGFDWDEVRLAEFEKFLANAQITDMKIELQGGEPTLRPDLINRIIDICERNIENVEFAICSNLIILNKEIEDIFAKDNVVVSTSIDGPMAVMSSNRTESDEMSKIFFDNVDHMIHTYGTEKLSALPTITDAIIDDPESLIDLYVGYGFSSIFLRPVNYMGFARKRYSDLSREFQKWDKFYNRALNYIVSINKERYFEEYYLALAARSIFSDTPHGFVDFRSPSRFAMDYCVIDFDGTIFPTDEARMLSRTKHADLSIGSMKTGINDEKVRQLNFQAIHQVDQDCIHCAYMPYCGIGVVDDLSRYGRIDVSKKDTWFCMRQTSLFDMIFNKVIEEDKDWLRVFESWIFRTRSSNPVYEMFA
jgi:His-Xaa-Ser system radical SAM maturase HxsB